MKNHTNFLIVTILSTVAIAAFADDSANCAAGDGTILTGVVVAGPHFAKAKETLKGVKLSHTHIGFQADGNSAVYDIAIDNVFAADFVKNSSSSPASLMAIKVGDRLQLCGRVYSPPEVGMDWVHTNCGDAPTTDKPNGWIKELGSNGQAGPNLDSTQTYCYLWR